MAGRVQGVWFRQSCLQRAEDAGVTGWVRNRDDGTVEVFLEGRPAAVDAVTDWCRQGPPRALVTGVSVEERDPEAHSSFRVLG